MIVLVTNTHSPQAYAIIRALRPHASRIVAAMEGKTRFHARLSHAANSRLVDCRYHVPSPAADWWAGNVGPDNTEREEAFVRAVADICDRERVDVIFPSWDPYVYVLSKNKARFEGMGVVVPVPDFETVLTGLDKYRTIEAAQKAGIPCPRTYPYEGGETGWIVEREGFPLVVKPRFTSGGRGLSIVSDASQLHRALDAGLRRHGRVMVQEYIPGGDRGSVQLVLEREGRVAFVFQKRRLRKLRGTARYGTVSESIRPSASADAAVALARRIGWWGGLGVETIVDPRDGIARLMEINPRFPRQLWNRTEIGINEPLMCIRIARLEEVEPTDGYPAGLLFVSPVEDCLLLGVQMIDAMLHAFRVRLLGRQALDWFDPPQPIRTQLGLFMQTYARRRRRVFDPYFGRFFGDPVVSILWWFQFGGWLAGSWKDLGR